MVLQGAIDLTNQNIEQELVFQNRRRTLWVSPYFTWRCEGYVRPAMGIDTRFLLMLA